MHKCSKCQSTNLGLRKNSKLSTATDLYCLDCGAWVKFANKDDIRLYSNNQSNNNSNLQTRKEELINTIQQALNELKELM